MYQSRPKASAWGYLYSGPEYMVIYLLTVLLEPEVGAYPSSSQATLTHSPPSTRLRWPVEGAWFPPPVADSVLPPRLEPEIQ